MRASRALRQRVRDKQLAKLSDSFEAIRRVEPGWKVTHPRLGERTTGRLLVDLARALAHEVLTRNESPRKARFMRRFM